MKAFVEAERARDPDLLLLNAGDDFVGGRPGWLAQGGQRLPARQLTAAARLALLLPLSGAAGSARRPWQAGARVGGWAHRAGRARVPWGGAGGYDMGQEVRGGVPGWAHERAAAGRHGADCWGVGVGVGVGVGWWWWWGEGVAALIAGRMMRLLLRLAAAAAAAVYLTAACGPWRVGQPL
jgi:hypothetical protein